MPEITISKLNKWTTTFTYCNILDHLIHYAKSFKRQKAYNNKIMPYLPSILLNACISLVGPPVMQTPAKWTKDISKEVKQSLGYKKQSRLSMFMNLFFSCFVILFYFPSWEVWAASSVGNQRTFKFIGRLELESAVRSPTALIICWFGKKREKGGVHEPPLLQLFKCTDHIRTWTTIGITNKKNCALKFSKNNYINILHIEMQPI